MPGNNLPYYRPRGLERGPNRNSDYLRDRNDRIIETSLNSEQTRSGRYFGEPSDPTLPPNRLYVHGYLPEAPEPLNTRLDSDISESSTKSRYQTGVLAGEVCSTDSMGPDYHYDGSPKSTCSTETVENEKEKEKSADELRRDVVLIELMEKPDVCQLLLDGMSFKIEGWCKLATKKGNVGMVISS